MSGPFPTAVVVDTADGMTYAADGKGTPFTRATAQAFADKRNARLKVGAPPLVVGIVKRLEGEDALTAALAEAGFGSGFLPPYLTDVDE